MAAPRAVAGSTVDGSIVKAGLQAGGGGGLQGLMRRVWGGEGDARQESWR